VPGLPLIARALLQDLFFRAIEEDKPRVLKMLLKKGGNPNIMMVFAN
jgi:hypothetical protein